jgi:hypothetical protein
MAPKKASKKTEEQPEGDIISDTTAAGVVHNVKSWAAIAEKMEDELSYTDNGTDNHLRDIAETVFIRLQHVQDWFHIHI